MIFRKGNTISANVPTGLQRFSKSSNLAKIFHLNSIDVNYSSLKQSLIPHICCLVLYAKKRSQKMIFRKGNTVSAKVPTWH